MLIPLFCSYFGHPTRPHRLRALTKSFRLSRNAIILEYRKIYAATRGIHVNHFFAIYLFFIDFYIYCTITATKTFPAAYL